MSRYVLVETVSQFHMRYVVEVPDNIEEELYFKDGTRTFPCTPEEWACDTVVCEEAKEFTQEWLGEVITSKRQVSMQEAIDLFRKEQPAFDSWPDEVVIKNHFTTLKEHERDQTQTDWVDNIKS